MLLSDNAVYKLRTLNNYDGSDPATTANYIRATAFNRMYAEGSPADKREIEWLLIPTSPTEHSLCSIADGKFISNVGSWDCERQSHKPGDIGSDQRFTIEPAELTNAVASPAGTDAYLSKDGWYRIRTNFIKDGYPDYLSLARAGGLIRWRFQPYDYQSRDYNSFLFKLEPAEEAKPPTPPEIKFRSGEVDCPRQTSFEQKPERESAPVLVGYAAIPFMYVNDSDYPDPRMQQKASMWSTLSHYVYWERISYMEFSGRTVNKASSVAFEMTKATQNLTIDNTFKLSFTGGEKFKLGTGTVTRTLEISDALKVVSSYISETQKTLQERTDINYNPTDQRYARSVWVQRERFELRRSNGALVTSSDVPTLLTVEDAYPETQGGVTAASGSGQSTVANSLFPEKLSALVVDAFMKPMPGVNVTFTGPGFDPYGLWGTATTVVVVTDRNGIATAPDFKAGGGMGEFKVTATSDSPAARNAAIFNLTVKGS